MDLLSPDLDRETRAGNNTRHFPESRTIKLVVSVTLALGSMACWSDSGKPREETCHQSGAIIEVTWHRGNQPEASIGVLNYNGEAFLKQTLERLLLPCARKLCNTSLSAVHRPGGPGLDTRAAAHCATSRPRVHVYPVPTPWGQARGKGRIHTIHTIHSVKVRYQSTTTRLSWLGHR